LDRTIYREQSNVTHNNIEVVQELSVPVTDGLSFCAVCGGGAGGAGVADGGGDCESGGNIQYESLDLFSDNKLRSSRLRINSI
jgi:hypothetical protein